MLKKYRLNDGSYNWHKLYFASMPRWTKKFSPPLGDMNYAGYLLEPHRYIADLYYRAKWFLQRGYRGFSDCDVWSIDGYLNKWMPEALRILADSKLGYPYGMTQRGWKTRLDAIVDGFVAAREIQDMTYDFKSAEERAAWRRFHRGMKLFHEHYFSLWD